MSTWIDSYLQASFKGVEFYIDSSSLKVGRKKVAHDYPNKDSSFIQDMGRKQRVYNLDCYIVDEDYFAHRNELIKIFESESEGILIHPYLGAINATLINDPVLRESTKEMNVVTFSLSFVENKKNDLTLIAVNNKNNVITKNAVTLTAAGTQFNTDYKLDFSLSNVIETLNDAILTSIEYVISARQMLAVDAVYNSYVSSFKNNIGSLLLQTDLLFDAVLTLLNYGTNYQSSTEYADEPSTQFNELEKIITWTTEQTQTQSNLSAFYNLMNNICVAALNNLLVSITYKSKQEATQYQLKVSTLINKIQIAENTTDTLYSALDDNKTAIRDFYTETIYNLKSESLYSIMQQSNNSLVLSYLLYGDLTEEQNIIDLNSVNDPCFITGKIKVLF